MNTFSFQKIFRWHVLAWLAFAIYSLLGGVFEGHPRQGLALTKWLWLMSSFLTARIIVFYFCYLVVYPRLLRVGRLPHLLLGLGVAALLFAGVRAGIEEVIYPMVLGFHNYTPDTTLAHYLRENVYYALPTLVLSATLWAGEAALRREREHRLLVGEKRAAEAAFLKTQINPHFLHNTLNMLYGMAYSVDKSLAAALLRLSELMRYMLHDTPDGQVEVRKEIEYLEHFLALYRLRFPNRLFAEFRVEGDPTCYRVAPLLLIPFVENAFKHGVLDDPTTPVRLHLTLHSDVITFIVENERHHYQADVTRGIGLTNLRRRLELLYEGRHTLQVGPVGTTFRAHLEIIITPQVLRPRPVARKKWLATRPVVAETI